MHFITVYHEKITVSIYFYEFYASVLKINGNDIKDIFEKRLGENSVVRVTNGYVSVEGDRFGEKTNPFRNSERGNSLRDYITVVSFLRSSRCNKPVCHCWAGKELLLPYRNERKWW